MRAVAISSVLFFVISSLADTTPNCENVTFLNPLRNRATWAIGAPIMLAYSFNCRARDCKHELRVGTFRGRFTCGRVTKIYQKKNKYRVECNTKHAVVLAAIMGETTSQRKGVPVNVTVQQVQCAGTGFRFRVKRCPESYTNKRLTVSSHGSLEYNSTGVVTCLDHERMPFSKGRPLPKNQTKCNANARWMGKYGIQCWKAPKVYLKTAGSVFEDNEEVAFGCTVKQGYPANTTTWLIVGDQKIAQPGKEKFVVDHRYHNVPVYCMAENEFTRFFKTPVKSPVTTLNILFPPTNFSLVVDQCSCRGSPQLCDVKFAVTFITNPLVEDGNIGVSDKNGFLDAKIARLTGLFGVEHSFSVDIHDINLEDLESVIFWANATILGHRYEVPYSPKLHDTCRIYTEPQTSTETEKYATTPDPEGLKEILDTEMPTEGGKNTKTTTAKKTQASTTNSTVEVDMTPPDETHEVDDESDRDRDQTTNKKNTPAEPSKPPPTRYIPRRKATDRTVTTPYSRSQPSNVTTTTQTTRPRMSTANTYIVIAVILLILLAVMLYFVVKAATDSKFHETESKEHSGSEVVESTQPDTA